LSRGGFWCTTRPRLGCWRRRPCSTSSAGDGAAGQVAGGGWSLWNLLGPAEPGTVPRSGYLLSGVPRSRFDVLAAGGAPVGLAAVLLAEWDGLAAAAAGDRAGKAGGGPRRSEGRGGGGVPGPPVGLPAAARSGRGRCGGHRGHRARRRRWAAGPARCTGGVRLVRRAGGRAGRGRTSTAGGSPTTPSSPGRSFSPPATRSVGRSSLRTTRSTGRSGTKGAARSSAWWRSRRRTPMATAASRPTMTGSRRTRSCCPTMCRGTRSSGA
jgi:hypothetical protein